MISVRMQRTDVGRRIREVRGRLGKTQTEFGRALGVIKTSVARYERGRIPRLPILETIAKLGGVTVAWLLHGEGRTQAPTPDESISRSQISRAARRLLSIVENQGACLPQLPPSQRRLFLERLEDLIERFERELGEYAMLLITRAGKRKINRREKEGR